MSDIQTQLPVKLTDNVNTAAITVGSALKIDVSATTANATAILVTGTGGTFPITGTLTTNTEYAEDSGHTSGDKGTFVLGVRNDTNAVLTSTDLDYSPMSVDSAGRVKVTGTLTATLTSQYAEDSGHITGDTGIFVLGVRNDSNATLTSTDLDYSPMAVDSAGRIKIGGTLTVTSGAEKAEDSGHVSGDTGNFVLAVRNDADATLTSTDLDYSPFSVDSTGRVKTAAPAEYTTSANIVAYYATVSSVANAATGTITYTVPVSKTFMLKQFIASSSGAPCKITLDDGTTTYVVGFYATSSPFFEVTFAQPISFAASSTVNLKIQNNSGSAQDVYGFLGGKLIA